MSGRHRLIDALKVVASNLIVLHHFTAYGPLAHALDLWHPALTDWFFEYARMAVQVFLVIGGYFAASALAPHGQFQFRHPGRHILQRYVRLVPPLAVALALIGVCVFVVRPWLTSDFLPVYTGVSQVTAHLGLAHGILGMEPLSIGIWYVGIDFQLFALIALALWVGGAYGKWVVVAIALASLFYFNLLEAGDNWAPYFFGAYGLGAVAWWLKHTKSAPIDQGGAHYRGFGMGVAWAALVAIGVLALAWDFRLRIALALLTALILSVSHQRLVTVSAPDRARSSAAKWLSQWLARLGTASYALFLTHFAVLILANAVWAQIGWTFANSPAVFALIAWLLCLPVALVFERFVERPLALLTVRR